MGSRCRPVTVNARYLIAVLLLVGSHAWAADPAQKSEGHSSKVSIELHATERPATITSNGTEDTTTSLSSDDEGLGAVRIDSPSATLSFTDAKEGVKKTRRPSPLVFGLVGAGAILMITLGVGIGTCAAQRWGRADTSVHALAQTIITVGGGLP